MKLFDRLQHVLFRVQREWNIINISRCKSLTIQIFKKQRQLFCEKFGRPLSPQKSLKKAKSLSLDEKIVGLIVLSSNVVSAHAYIRSIAE